MEIFFIPAKANLQRALSGAVQLSIPAPNQRLLMAAGAFVSPEEAWHRRTRAKGLEKLLQDASLSLKNLSELWPQLSKKLPEILQNPLVVALLLEDGAFEGRFFGLGSLLIKGETKQKIVALQGDAVSLSAELIAGATEMIFFEESVDKAEEIAGLLQETEQVLGKASVRRLLTTAPSEPISAPLIKGRSDTPREVVVPKDPSPAWQQYLPWGVAALMTLLLATSLLLPSSTQNNVAASKKVVVDTKPKFIPQPEEPVVEAKKPDKKKPTEESPGTQPTEASESGTFVLPLSLPVEVLPEKKPKETPKTKPPEKTTKPTKKTTR